MAGFARDSVFITNVVKCRPPENRDPQPNELQACSAFLEQQIEAIDPLIIITLGRFSMARYFENVRISDIHGKPAWQNGQPDRSHVSSCCRAAPAEIAPGYRCRISLNLKEMIEKEKTAPGRNSQSAEKPEDDATQLSFSKIRNIMDHTKQLINKFEDQTAKVAVLGLGYVGLPLAVVFAESGFKVIGIDPIAEKVDTLNAGQKLYPRYRDRTDREALVKSGALSATTDFSVLSEVDAVSICVPTPLRKTGDPDLSYILSVAETLQEYHPSRAWRSCSNQPLTPAQRVN